MSSRTITYTTDDCKIMEIEAINELGEITSEKITTFFNINKTIKTINICKITKEVINKTITKEDGVINIISEIRKPTGEVIKENKTEYPNKMESTIEYQYPNGDFKNISTTKNEQETNIRENFIKNDGSVIYTKTQENNNEIITTTKTTDLNGEEITVQDIKLKPKPKPRSSYLSNIMGMAQGIIFGAPNTSNVTQTIHNGQGITQTIHNGRGTTTQIINGQGMSQTNKRNPTVYGIINNGNVITNQTNVCGTNQQGITQTINNGRKTTTQTINNGVITQTINNGRGTTTQYISGNRGTNIHGQVIGAIINDGKYQNVNIAGKSQRKCLKNVINGKNNIIGAIVSGNANIVGDINVSRNGVIIGNNYEDISSDDDDYYY